MITSRNGWSHLTSESSGVIGFCIACIYNATYYFCPTKWICPKLWPSGFHADDVRPHSFSLGDNYAIRWSKLTVLIVLNSCPLQMAHNSCKGTQMNLGENKRYSFIQGPVMQGDRDNRCETCKMNSLVLCLIPGYQHNLVSDLVTVSVRPLHSSPLGFLGQKSVSQGPTPPFHPIVTLPLCRVYTQPDDWMINGHARGAIDNFWWVYTKAMLVTLAPV